MGDFPGREMEISYQYRDHVEQTVCHVRDAGRVIEQYCKKFPLATVYYHGSEGYEFLAQVRCHCGHEKSRGCCRDGNHHRAKILVSLVPVAQDAGAQALDG